jgi:hypothetical protein
MAASYDAVQLPDAALWLWTLPSAPPAQLRRRVGMPRVNASWTPMVTR